MLGVFSFAPVCRTQGELGRRRDLGDDLFPVGGAGDSGAVVRGQRVLDGVLILVIHGQVGVPAAVWVGVHIGKLLGVQRCSIRIGRHCLFVLSGKPPGPTFEDLSVLNEPYADKASIETSGAAAPWAELAWGLATF